jgi:hypothetical protein
MSDPFSYKGDGFMQFERRQGIRYPFRAVATVTHTETSEELRTVSSEIGRFGCFLQTDRPFPYGARVWLEIEHAGLAFEADAKVAYVLPGGMGIVFSTVEYEDELVLQLWLAYKIE